MFNTSQPYTGDYFTAEWLSYNDETEEYEVPVIIRFKPQTEGSQGVSSSVKEDTLEQTQNGREVVKGTFTIQVLENHNYKARDKIRIISEDRMYTVKRKGYGYGSIMDITNLMFPNSDNRPTILFLGDN